MKLRFRVFVAFILASFIVSCNPPVLKPTQGLPSKTSALAQKLRVTNQSAYTISDLKVRFPNELIAFGDVLPGETTEYQAAAKGVYRYAAYDVEVDGKDYKQPVMDWVGESPIQGGSFTYILEVDPSRWQTEGQVIKLVDVRVDQITGSELTLQPTPYFTIPPIIQPTPTFTALTATTTPILPQAKPSIKPFQDVASKNTILLNENRDLGEALIETLFFDQSTIWSAQDQPVAENILKLAMNPGMGIRNLHAAGVTGKGVTVAIIDHPLVANHPEFKGKIAKYHDVGTNIASNIGSLHGPAVTSLLVGENIGTAPGAKVYYVAAPSWFLDAQYYADALDWLIAENEKLPAEGKIRVVSVSAAPSGVDSPFTKNQAAWDQAYQRATEAGMLVLDASYEHGLTHPCHYDLTDPDNVAKCIPEWLGSINSPRIYIPVRRTTATERWKEGDFSYLYSGTPSALSWTIPYLAGVLALGWQINPDLTSAQLLDKLYASAYVTDKKSKIINPKAFIDLIRLTVSK